MILDEIVANKREKVASLKEHFNVKALCSMAKSLPKPRDFLSALRTTEFALIAEIKKASPSAGLIREDFDPRSLAKIYDENGAMLYKHAGNVGRPTYIDKDNEDYKPGKYKIHFVYHVNEWGYWRNKEPLIVEIKPGKTHGLGYSLSWGNKPKEFVKLNVVGKTIKLDKIKSYD